MIINPKKLTHRAKAYELQIAISMKTSNILSVIGLVVGIASLAGCASLIPPGEAGKGITVNGPSVSNERTAPKVFELNRQLQPKMVPEVLADVKDFKAGVESVQLKFLHVPLEVPMKNIGGTTWQATLSQKELQKLAVSGTTVSYDANVVAKDKNGQVAESTKPVSVIIKAPDLAKSAT